MLYLIEYHWPWLAAALLLGAVVGWFGTVGPTGPRWAGWLSLAAAAALVGAGLSLFSVLPGRAGYALDLGLIFVVAYASGCVVGALARGVALSPPARLVVPVAAGDIEIAATVRVEEVETPVTAPAAVEPVEAPPADTTVAAAEPVKPFEEAPATPSPSPASVEEPAPAPIRSYPGRRPPVLAAPLGLGKDELFLIKGIGPRNEKLLNGLGIFHFCQIADWSAGEAEWIGHAMAFPGRIEREHWIEQARVLCAGEETDYAEAVHAGRQSPSDEPLSAAEGARLKTALMEAAHRGRKPPVLAVAQPPGKDELGLIKGIGPRNERILNSLGIFHFCQIADWAEPEAEWIGHAMAFPGRVQREHWIDQAGILCKGGDTDHSRAVKAGEAQPSDAALSAAEAARIRAGLG